MGIDGRVAHGIAGRHLEDALAASGQVLGRIHASIARRPTRPGTAKAARRELREFRNAVIQHSLWWTDGEDRHDGPYLAWLGARGEPGGDLILSRFRFSPAATRTLPARMSDVGRLSLHAVARCLQRNQTLAWDGLKPILAEATSAFLLMSAAAKVASLRQFLVPAGEGLFVGRFNPEGESRMDTYLVPDEGVRSRWHPVRAAVRAAVRDSGLEMEDAHRAATYGASAACVSAVAGIATALSAYYWLRQDYEPKLDPVSAAWNDYRAKVASEPDMAVFP
ncbi:MAG: hypothetical protein ACT4P4_22575 [Betaproteobacteria bacterium]